MVLKEVDFSASGNYTCVVMGESPGFREDTMTKVMTVVGKTRNLFCMHCLIMFALLMVEVAYL